MLLKSIGYMAVLLDYIAQGLNCSVREVAEQIGEKGIERLCHNAPMNCLLPISRIAQEVINDYDLPAGSKFCVSWKNELVGETYIKAVGDLTTDKNQYVPVFFSLITGKKQ